MEEPQKFRFFVRRNGRLVEKRRGKRKRLPAAWQEMLYGGPTIEQLAETQAAELAQKGFPEDPDLVTAYREMYEVLSNRRDPPRQCQDLFAQTPPPGSPDFGTQLHSAFIGLRGKQERSALRGALERCIGKTLLAALHGPLRILLKNGGWSRLEYKGWGSYEDEINLQVFALLLDEAEARLAVVSIGEPHAPKAPLPPARHSPDFRSVHWYGEEYSFTGTQAACVKILWEAWEKGTPELGEAYILENARGEAEEAPLSSLRVIFHGNRAWGTMIRPGGTKGSCRLVPPA